MCLQNKAGSLLWCRLQNYCDPSLNPSADAAFVQQGRSFFCSNLDSNTGLPTGNEFNWAVMHMLMVENDFIRQVCAPIHKKC